MVIKSPTKSFKVHMMMVIFNIFVVDLNYIIRLMMAITSYYLINNVGKPLKNALMFRRHLHSQ